MSSRATIATIALALTLPTTAAAAVATEASTTASGTAATRPVSNSILSTVMDSTVAHGAVGMVAEGWAGSNVWADAAGTTSLATGTPAKVNAEFRAASNTKMIVGVLAMQQVASGRWNLDTTTVEQVLPGLLPGAAGQVTLRQLLSHTSGIQDFTQVLLADAVTPQDLLRVVSARYTDAQLVASVANLPLLPLAPGVGSYSNTNYVILGMMLAQATGQALPDLARRSVLQPAGMTDTRLATTTYLRPGALTEWANFGTMVDFSGFNPTFFSGAGSMVTTPRDLNRFHLALNSGRLLPKSYVEQMHTVNSIIGGQLEYGLASYRVADVCGAGYVWGHDGASFATLSVSLSTTDAKRRLTVALTGRNYVAPANPTPWNLVTVAMSQSCDSPADATPQRRAAFTKGLANAHAVTATPVTSLR